MTAVSAPPTAIAQKKPRKFTAWRLGLAKRAREASHRDLEEALSSLEWFESFCCGLVFLGVALEVLIAAENPPYGSPLERWGSPVATTLVALGVLGELIAGIRERTIQGELTRRSNDKLADAIKSAGEANERASEADLKRADLETRLQPRMTDQRQFDLIQALSGKLEEVSIIHNSTAEPRWFSNSLREAFFSANIRVGMYRISSDNPTEGIFIYDPGMRDAKPSSVCELLVEVFRGTNTPVAIVTGLALGVFDVPTEYPAIIVGERLAVLPPHIEKRMQIADAAYAKMKGREPRT